MKEKFKQFIKEQYMVFISSSIVFLFMLLFLIIHKVEPFGDKTMIRFDCLHQYYPFLTVLYDKLKNGESLYYYWNSGLGANYLLNYIYNLTCPLNFFVIFVKREHITIFITFLIVIKLALSAGSFSFYLSSKDIQHSKMMNMTLSIAYGLTNFAICYSHELMWLDAYVLLPIIIYGFEKILSDKKPFIYILSLALCAYCNVYPTFFVAIFLILLFLFFEHKNVKDFFVNGLVFGGSSILAAGLSGFTLFISVINLSSTYTSNDVIDGHTWYGNIFEVIRYLFIFSKPTTVSYDFNHANLYCGTFAIIFLFVYIFIRNIKILTKIKNVFLILFLLISMNESILNYFWHGFHIQTGVPNRFSFILIFILLSLSYDTFCQISKENIRNIFIGVIIAECFPMVSYFFTDFDSFFESKIILLLSLTGVIVYSILIILLAYIPKVKKYLTLVLATVMMAEIFVNSWYVLSDYTNIKKDSYMVSSIYDVMHKIKQEEKEFFRSEIPSDSANLNACYGINGMAVFSSWYPYESAMRLFDLGASVSSNAVKAHELAEPVEDIFGIKYIISTEDNKVYNEKENYIKVYDKKNICVYENANSLPILYASNNRIKEFLPVENGLVYDNLNNLGKAIHCDDNICDKANPQYDISVENCEINIFDTDHLEFGYHTDTPDKKMIKIDMIVPENGEYTCYFGNDGGRCGISIYVNDIYFNSLSAADCILLGLGKRKKDDKVTLVIQGQMESTELLDQNDSGLYGILIAKINNNELNKLVKYTNDNSFDITEIKDGYIRGSIELGTDQVLFSSIPFDKNWKVYDNGKRVSPENYAGFMGLDLGEGMHDLKFEYFPEEIIPGICITCFSWVILLFVYLLSRKRKLGSAIDSKVISDNEGRDEETTKG